MLGLAVGLAGLGSSIFGAVKAKKARKKAEREQRRILDQMGSENEENFMRDYYRNAFDDPSSKAYLKRISEQAYDRSKGIENAGVSTGATHENVLAQKESANKVVNDAVNNVVVNHEAKKTGAKDRYMQRKDAIASGNIELARETGEMQAQNWSNLGNNLAGSLTGMAAPYLESGSNLFNWKKK